MGTVHPLGFSLIVPSLYFQDWIATRKGESINKLFEGGRLSFLSTFLPRLVSICLIALLPPAGMQAEPAPAPVGTVARPNSVPGIRADPESVKIGLQLGRTMITWDAGASPLGEVYVSVNGRAEALIAQGVRGSVEADVRPGKSAVTLYGGANRTNLIGRTVVEGVAVPIPKTRRSTSSAREMAVSERPRRSWELVARWGVALGVLSVFIVGAIYLASRGKPRRTELPLERQISSLNRAGVLRRLLGGIAACLVVDGLLFHTDLYPSLVWPGSIPDYSHRVAAREKLRRSSPSKEILLVGDSRIGRGFSAELATKRGTASGYSFVNVAIGGSTPRLWHYLLRQIDPDAERYAAIGIPVEFRDSQRWAVLGNEYLDRQSDIALIAPLLRYGDAGTFASSFESWTRQCEAFTACVLRGFAYRADLFDLFENPARRYRLLTWQKQGPSEGTLEKFLPAEHNVVGTSYDSQTGKLTLPNYLTREQAASIRKAVSPPPGKETGRWVRYRQSFVGEIQQRYAKSRTRLVLFQMPRAPIVPSPEPPEASISTIASLVNDRTLLLGRDLFEFLEAPEYFADGAHLNALGRHEFSQQLADEIIPLLQARGDGSFKTENK